MNSIKETLENTLVWSNVPQELVAIIKKELALALLSDCENEDEKQVRNWFFVVINCLGF